ncbi:hypothetical protein [Actinacidiphila glaucinigra]|uniref:hypothetical protein n=1 Tax=Actinacidiphila glaucinigra TaxID=235986 RepID=UPI003715B159
MATGRTNEPKTVSITTTSGQPSITAAAGTFTKPEDIGRTVTGTGIQADTTITAIASDTAATLSLNATASGARTVTLGRANPQAYGFGGWSPESDTEADAYTVAAVNAGTAQPDAITNPTTRANQRARS